MRYRSYCNHKATRTGKHCPHGERCVNQTMDIDSTAFFVVGDERMEVLREHATETYEAIVTEHAVSSYRIS